MKKSILITAISLFLLLSSTSFAVANIVNDSEGGKCDLTVDIKDVTHHTWYFEVQVEVSNIGGAAVDCEDVCICLKILSHFEFQGENYTMITHDGTDNLAELINLTTLDANSAVNVTLIGDTTYTDSIIHVRIDPPCEGNPNGKVLEENEDNNTDQFVYGNSRPRTTTNPLIAKIANMFPRIFGILQRLLSL